MSSEVLYALSSFSPINGLVMISWDSVGLALVSADSGTWRFESFATEAPVCSAARSVSGRKGLKSSLARHIVLTQFPRHLRQQTRPVLFYVVRAVVVHTLANLLLARILGP